MKNSVFRKGKVFIIHAMTGCTCCSIENHYRGLYRTKEDAERRKGYYRSKDSNFWPLASQYASRGIYYIEEKELEILPDGRFIIDCRVFDPEELRFIDVNSDGTISKDNAEYFCSEDDLL